jgi:serine/threonine protein kinase
MSRQKGGPPGWGHAPAAASNGGQAAEIARMLIGGYQIERRIGRGGMAEVFLGREVGGPRAGSPVAIKRLLPALLVDRAQAAMFAREAELARRLDHPGIVRVLASGTDAAGAYLVTEYVDGCDLARLLAACSARGLRLPTDFALYVAHAVAEALDSAHRARGAEGRALGLVHCDVSPSNVFVSRSGEVKLGDFGVARAAGDGPARAAFGKIRYLAPELLDGRPVTPAVDVFGLGAVLFELLTGDPAFPGADATAVTRLILEGERQLPSAVRPDVAPAVDALVTSALAADPAMRPESAGAMAAELATIYDERVGTPLAIAALVRGVMGV